MMRVAVVGLGNAGTGLHLPALAPLQGVEVVGACDVDAERRARAQDRWGVPVFPDSASLYRSARPDAVIVCTPPDTHAAMCREAFAAGAHVVCEKPLAVSIAEADAILEAAEDADRRIALNYEFREMPIARAILEETRRPDAAPVFLQVWQNMDLPPWKEPGWRAQLMRGVLFEAGIHLVDYCLAAFGQLPVAVSAAMSTCGVRPEASDAVAMVTLEFPGGRLAHVVQNRLCPGDTQYFEVRADTPAASFRASFGGRARVTAGLYRSTRPHMRLEFGPSGVAWKELGARRTILARNPRDAGMVATRSLLEKTFAAFDNDTEPPASGRDGRAGLAVLAAAYASATEGRRVSLDPEGLAPLAAVPIGQSQQT